MRTVSIVGARPQLIKIAPVCKAIERHNAAGAVLIDDMIVHTGQHYDARMSDVFFTELRVPQPAVNLGVGSGTHGQQTGRMLEALERVLLEHRPDVVIVYGDTNSTVAGSLAAAKLELPIVHVEAGLRSFNRSMPEEINRIVADHLGDLLLAPTMTAMRNLEKENLGARAAFTGDVMYDAVIDARRTAEGVDLRREVPGLPEEYGLVTVHRAENTTPEALPEILALLGRAAERLPLVFPMHPRTRAAIAATVPGWEPGPRLLVVEPLGYLAMIALLARARVLLTDSGGMQKEALFVDTPCVTLRTETEWVETVEAGGNRIVGRDADKALAAVDEWLARPAWDFSTGAAGHFGDGNAADEVVRRIVGMNDH